MQFNPTSECYEREGYDPVRKSDILSLINSYGYVPDYITQVLERKEVKCLAEDDMLNFTTHAYFLDYPYFIESLMIVSEMYPDSIRKIINGYFTRIRTSIIQCIVRSECPEKTIGYLFMLGFGESPETDTPINHLNFWEYDLKIDFRLVCWLSIYYRNNNQQRFALILNTFFKYGLSLDEEGCKTHHDLGLAQYSADRTFKESYVPSKEGFMRLSSMYYRYVHEMTLYDRLTSSILSTNYTTSK